MRVKDLIQMVDIDPFFAADDDPERRMPWAIVSVRRSDDGDLHLLLAPVPHGVELPQEEAERLKKALSVVDLEAPVMGHPVGLKVEQLELFTSDDGRGWIAARGFRSLASTMAYDVARLAMMQEKADQSED